MAVTCDSAYLSLLLAKKRINRSHIRLPDIIYPETSSHASELKKNEQKRNAPQISFKIRAILM